MTLWDGNWIVALTLCLRCSGLGIKHDVGQHVWLDVELRCWRSASAFSPATGPPSTWIRLARIAKYPSTFTYVGFPTICRPTLP